MSGTILTSRLLDQAGVPHGFTTRPLGDVMHDLSGWEQESGLNQGSLVRLKQVHGTDVLVVDRSVDQLPPEEERRFDAAVTNQADTILSIRTADCVPVLLFSPGAVAAVHAGWRGTLDGVVKHAVEALVENYGCRADSILAAIGPCIHSCCYRVGQDVWEPFTKNFRPDVLIVRGEDHFVDLVTANSAWLLRSGVQAANIDVLKHCTHCNSDLFFSYRRDASAGRQLAFVTL